MSLLRPLTRSLALTRPVRLPLTSSTRSLHLHRTPALLFPRKNTQDKDSMDTNPTEYSKSGGDPMTAQTDTAFDGNNTSPEGQEASAAKETVSFTFHVMCLEGDI